MTRHIITSEQHRRIAEMRAQQKSWRRIAEEINYPGCHAGLRQKHTDWTYRERERVRDRIPKPKRPAEGFPALKHKLHERLQRVADWRGEYWTLDGRPVTIQEAVRVAEEV